VVLPCAGRQVLVLAIEDNLDTIQLWRRYTQKTRFSLVAETDPEQAIASAARLHPDLIVLDIMLPGIDGWDLLKRLRADPATASIPVIVCTVLPQKELAFSLGARDFIPKPTTGEEFRAALERQISAATLSR
jgi:CheY-like chemotaxis protein